MGPNKSDASNTTPSSSGTNKNLSQQRKKPELLAPAGDFEKLRFAFAYGADAVYAGLPMFSLRTKENRFDLEGVTRGIEYAHKLGKKIYITANIYAHNIKIEPFLEAMHAVSKLGADAYIMSDPGLIDIVKEEFPNIEVHLSTQANNTNWAQARFWKKLGVSRIILARELSLNEIREIATKCPDIETEVFVHGAMCMAYSGRCMLSDYMTGRPSNSGACTQSCRWDYKVAPSLQEKSNYCAPEPVELIEKKRPDSSFRVEEDEFGTYIFNSKDLCAIELIPEIIETGVNSIKIEGRNKNFMYLATAIRSYREAIDAHFDGTYESKKQHWIDELNSINYRGYTQGFFNGVLSNTQNFDRKSEATKAYGARIIRPLPGHFYEIEIKNKITVGDTVEWLTPDRGILSQTITQITDPDGTPLNTIAAGGLFHPRIYSELDLNAFSLMRVRQNSNGEI
jgi:putative protease